MEKPNCWEVKKCGRRPGGEHEKDLGICPAAIEIKLDDVHGGENAGRACWAVAGTFCGGQVQGSFARKYLSCEKCDFYRMVAKEEGQNLKTATFLLKKQKFG